VSDHDLSRDLVESEAEKQVEEIINQVNPPPQIREKLRETLVMFMAGRFDGRPSLPPESLQILTGFLEKDSDNNKELALREIESNEKLGLKESQREDVNQAHSIWVSKLLHASGVIIGAAILLFSGYLILNGNQDLGMKVISHGLAFMAGMGIKKMIS